MGNYYAYDHCPITTESEFRIAFGNLTQSEQDFYKSFYGRRKLYHQEKERAFKIINQQGKEGRFDFLKCIQRFEPNTTNYLPDVHTDMISFLLTHRTVKNVMMYLIGGNSSLLFQEWNIKLTKALIRFVLYEKDDAVAEFVEFYKKEHKHDSTNMNIVRLKRNLNMISQEEQVFLCLKWGI